MESTTVDPKNKAAIGCSVITTERANDKGIATRANGPKFSVEQGDETLEIPLNAEGCYINEFGEIIRQDGSKTGATMSKAEHDRYGAYRKNIAKKREQIKGGFEH